LRMLRVLRVLRVLRMLRVLRVLRVVRVVRVLCDQRGWVEKRVRGLELGQWLSLGLGLGLKAGAARMRHYSPFFFYNNSFNPVSKIERKKVKGKRYMVKK